MAGSDRAVGVLKLFTLERPIWTVEQAADAIGVSASSAYRYVAALTEAGLLTQAGSGSYTLGPAIIQYDRQIQITDPLLRASKPVMADLMPFAPSGSAVLLCRVFRDRVLCVHQIVDPDQPTQGSYERGRPMPLFRGATSKVILAHLGMRELRPVFDRNRAEIAAAALGDTWEGFRTTMARLRRAGHVISRAELDPGSMGIAAPLLDEGRRVLGSLSYVIPLAREAMAARLAALVMAGAREVEQGIRSAPIGKAAE